MKALYFGPYKYNNLLGECSRNIISSLNNKGMDLTTHHIYINNPYSNTTLIETNDNKTIKIGDSTQYDLIIEHATLPMLSINRNIGLKHIAIPLMDYSVERNELAILEEFDDIIVDDVLHQQNLSDNKIGSTYIKYSFDPIQSDLRINFDYHLPNKKLYFLGELKSNQNIINKIIISFILACRTYDDVSLVLVLTDDNPNETEKHIDNIIRNILQKMNYKHRLCPIKVLCIKPSIRDLHLIHQSCDVLIDLYDNYSSGINHAMASLYNKAILDITNLDHIIVPSTEYEFFDHTDLYKKSILTSSLVSKMTEYCDSGKISYTQPHKKFIEDMVC